jgi:hypothetical protein
LNLRVSIRRGKRCCDWGYFRGYFGAISGAMPVQASSKPRLAGLLWGGKLGFDHKQEADCETLWAEKL